MFYYIRKFKKFFEDDIHNGEIYRNLKLLAALGKAAEWDNTKILKKFNEYNLDEDFDIETQFISDCGVGGKYVDIIKLKQYPDNKELYQVMIFDELIKDRLTEWIRAMDNEKLLKLLKHILDTDEVSYNKIVEF